MTILQPNLSPVLGSILRSPFDAGGGGAAAWTPAQLYPAAVLWLDPSTAGSGFQESTASTPAVLDAPIGYRADLSGNALHIKQATSAARPTWKLNGATYSDLFDGVDDGYLTAAFAGGTLTADMDCFIALKRNADANNIPFNDGGSRYFAVTQTGDGSAPHNDSGTPTYAVNGVGIAATRAAISTATPIGSWAILEVRNLDLTLWLSFGISTFGGWPMSMDVGGVVLCPAQSAGNRTLIRQYLADKVGVTL